ncbi:MAG: 6-bladed beta-propeller [Gemmatimonadota bacterium]|nr:6-bladed beta-propeller [Gemmatimonadota bacterium]
MDKAPAMATVVVSALSVAGCYAAPSDESGVAEQPAFTTWDSAGIEIVVNHAPEHAAGEFWTFGTVPEIVLGGAEDLGALANDPSQLIWEVVGLVRLEDGRVAVLSSMGKQLLLFEPSGALSRTIGRGGEGPGEFTRPEWLQYLPPDTLVVWDYFLRSVAYFDTAGTLLRQRRVDQALLREAGASGEAFVRPLPDGTFVVSVRGGPDNERVESMGWNPRTSSLQTFGGRVGNYARIDDSYRPQVLGPRSGIATGGDPPSIYLSGRGRNEIRQLSLDGAVLRIIRRTTDPIPVTDRAYQNILERAYLSAEAMGSPVPREIIEQMIEREETHPPMAGIIVDPEGYLWVREGSRSESGTPDQWSVFNPEGRWIGVLPFPWNTDPAEENSCGGNTRVRCWVDRDFLLAVRQDEFGVERVEGYRIRRGG